MTSLRFEGYDETYARAARLSPEGAMRVLRELLCFALDAHAFRKDGAPEDGVILDFVRWILSERGNHPSCVYPGYCRSIRYLEPVPDGYGETGAFETNYGAVGMPELIAWYDRYTRAVAIGVRRLRAIEAEKHYPPPSPPPDDVVEAMREAITKLKHQHDGQ